MLPFVLPLPSEFLWQQPLRDGQAIDVQVIADTIDDTERPSEVYNRCKDKVGAQIPQFHLSAYGLVAKQWGEIDEDGAADQRVELDCPVREWLPCQVREDDLCRHPSEHEGHSHAEEDEAVFTQQG